MTSAESIANVFSLSVWYSFLPVSLFYIYLFMYHLFINQFCLFCFLFVVTCCIRVTMPAFPACKQCWIVGLSPDQGLNFVL